MGKTIVITGAGVGLGRALARRFVSEGECVVLLGRTGAKVEELAKELGDAAMAAECDVGSPDSVRAAFAAIAARHPKIDVLINNAAIYEPFKVASGTDDQIMSAVNTNLAGPILCARAAIPMMGQGGCIINVSSESVAQPFAMLALYQCTKAGLERFSDTLRDELAPEGIRVATVRAGPMYEIGKAPPTWDMQAAMQFHQECAANGLDFSKRPVSNVTSVTDVFRMLLDLPGDVRLDLVTVGARTSE